MAHRTLPLDLTRQAEELRALGRTNTQIAEALGVSGHTVRRWIGSSVGRLAYERNVAEAKRLRVEEKLNNGQIADRMGVEYRQVWSWIGANPLRGNVRLRSVPNHVYDEAVRLRREGKLNNQEIADAVGVHVTTVYKWMGASPASARRARDYSDTQYHSRAMYLRECGYNVREISDIMGVPKSTVGGWVKGYGCYGTSLD